MSRVPAGATAFGNRDAGFLMNYIGLWLDPGEDDANIAGCARHPTRSPPTAPAPGT